ncbi:uncharacterized protein LOC135166412 isoform X2 [Diachasmimorpha longicaudata]|uniref:uncharacterized protein LOC135166412 isoform X2 n=1 Tax=Diachasmimorpha longicaudata TaxID=58733 RepID=UPI0030B8783E
MGARLSTVKSYASPMVGARTCSSEEKREGEMKRELSGKGLYEDGMTCEEMSAMIQAYNASINNSGEMSHQNSLSEIIPSTPPAEGTSHKPSRSTRDSTSPERPSATFSNYSKILNKKSPEDKLQKSSEGSSEPAVVDGPLHVLSPSPPRYGMPNATSETPSPSQSVTNLPKKIQNVPQKLPSLLQGLRTEIWRIDPWDPKQEKDVPLKKLQRFQGSRPPARYKMVDGVPQIPDELKKFVDMSLMECHISYYEDHKDEYSNEVEWGSPIKMATGTWNGSLDKVIRPECEIPERSQSQEKSAMKPESEVLSCNVYDDDDDKDFESSRKRSKPSECRALGPVMSASNRRTRTTPRLKQSPMEEDESTKSDNKDANWMERPKTPSSRKRPVKSRDSSGPQVAKSTRDVSPEFEPQEIPPELRGKTSTPSDGSSVKNEPVYPRRISPPNPSRFRGPRSRKTVGVSNLLSNRPQLSVERITRKKPETSLTSDEIEALITDDEDDSPIFVPQKARTRSETVSTVVDVEAQEDRKKKEVEKRRRDQEDREKQERVQRRIREEKQLIRAKEGMATLEKERRDKYKAGGPARLGRRTELEDDSTRKTILNWDSENRPTPSADEVEDMFAVAANAQQGVQCPICSKYFPHGDEIETHAANCGDSFADGNEGDEEEGNRGPSSGRRSANAFECLKCGNYWTRDGHEFEEHVAKCINDSETGGSRSAPRDIPDSPIRSFTVLSSIKNSEIDYAAQLRRRKAPPRGTASRKRRKQF